MVLVFLGFFLDFFVVSASTSSSSSQGSIDFRDFLFFDFFVFFLFDLFDFLRVPVRSHRSSATSGVSVVVIRDVVG